jgi:hypothetical protein
MPISVCVQFNIQRGVFASTDKQRPDVARVDSGSEPFGVIMGTNETSICMNVEDEKKKYRLQVTRLSAKIASRIMACLDEAGPTYFDTCEREGARLQAEIEEIVKTATTEFIKEWRR